jgi:hypothetical protein
MGVGDVNNLMGLLPKSAVIVSQRPPLWRSGRERRRGGSLLRRSCLRPDIVLNRAVTFSMEGN